MRVFDGRTGLGIFESDNGWRVMTSIVTKLCPWFATRDEAIAKSKAMIGCTSTTSRLSLRSPIKLKI